MAQFRNTETGDLITVFDELIDMHDRLPVWERVDIEEPADTPADEPDGSDEEPDTETPSGDAEGNTNSTSTRRRG